MEDALISPAGFMILSGAGLVEPTSTAPIQVHCTEQIELVSSNIGDSAVTITLGNKVSSDDDADIYVMILDDNGEVESEPYIAKKATTDNDAGTKIEIKALTSYTPDLTALTAGKVVLVDYYTDRTSGVKQIEITPDKFGGNFYLEASTLFRDTQGNDMPAEFIIPNCKIQSNFTFTMASSGDPSSFTFTMDAFPDYTRFDKTKKVLSAIQIVEEDTDDADGDRTATSHNYSAS